MEKEKIKTIAIIILVSLLAIGILYLVVFQYIKPKIYEKGIDDGYNQGVYDGAISLAREQTLNQQLFFIGSSGNPQNMSLSTLCGRINNEI